MNKDSDLNKRSGFYVISPEDAGVLLRDRAKNRGLSQLRIQKYARRMREGLWKSDRSQPLLFDEDTGQLVDGQHRLEGLIVNGKPMRFLCLYAQWSMPTLDENKPRAARDVLAAFTEGQNNSVRAAAARRAILYDRAKKRSADVFVLPQRTEDIDNSEILRYVKVHPELDEQTEKVLSWYRKAASPLPPSDVTALLHITSRSGAARAENWWQGLVLQEGLMRGDVRLAVHRLFLRETKNKQMRPQVGVTFARLLKAWQQKDEEVGIFYLRTSELMKFTD